MVLPALSAKSGMSFGLCSCAAVSRVDTNSVKGKRAFHDHGLRSHRWPIQTLKATTLAHLHRSLQSDELSRRPNRQVSVGHGLRRGLLLSLASSKGSSEGHCAGEPEVP